MAERLTVGVAARLSRYLQVLTQAKKMGKERISSQEISEYTNINATQIRRDLSNFGRFGKRGVGYNIDSLLVGDPQDPAHAGPAQHRARRRRPARSRDRELADLRRARDQHRGRLRQRPRQGRAGRRRRLRDAPRHARRARPRAEHHRRRPRGARGRRAEHGRCARRRGREDHLQLLAGAPTTPADVQVHTSNPAVELLYALYFHLT